MDTPPIELSVSGAVAELRIAGAISLDWTRMLQRHAAELRARDDMRVVRISATGRFFCPGGDLRWMAQQDDRRAAVRELADTLHAGLRDLAALDAPVVAEVQGVTAGAGMSVVLGADIAVAGASRRSRSPTAAWGCRRMAVRPGSSHASSGAAGPLRSCCSTRVWTRGKRSSWGS